MCSLTVLNFLTFYTCSLAFFNSVILFCSLLIQVNFYSGTWEHLIRKRCHRTRCKRSCMVRQLGRDDLKFVKVKMFCWGGWHTTTMSNSPSCMAHWYSVRLQTSTMICRMGWCSLQSLWPFVRIWTLYTSTTCSQSQRLSPRSTIEFLFHSF